MSKQKFDVVLFDIDGTILDTREFIFQAYKYTIALHLNKEVTWAEVAPTLGLSLRECYRILTGLEDVNHLMVTHDEFQYRNFQLIVAYRNTQRVLESFKKARIAMGAITNRYGKQVLQSLKTADIDEYFKMILTPLDVINPKPDPESIFKVLKRLGVSAKRAVFIGDSPADIEAGKAAGVKTIAALYGFHGGKLAESKPDFLVGDIEQIIPIILDSTPEVAM